MKKQNLALLLSEFGECRHQSGSFCLGVEPAQ
jgi:hypothetical protein